jgi:hypothetical protein
MTAKQSGKVRIGHAVDAQSRNLSLADKTILQSSAPSVRKKAAEGCSAAKFF